MLAPRFPYRLASQVPSASDSLRGLNEIGGEVVDEATGWWRALHFSGIALVTGLSPSAYDARARTVAVNQIYFSAWQVLGWFTLACAVLCFLIVRIALDTAAAYGFAQFALQMLLQGLVLEAMPVGVALFVGLRSGAAIATEVSIFHIRGDLERIAQEGGDPMRHELMPRIMGTIVAVTALTFANSAVAMVVLYLQAFGVSPWGLPEFLRVTAAVFSPLTVLGAALKALLLGAAVALIPIAEALRTPREMRLAPVAVLRAMVRLMLVLAVIEGAFLTVTYVL